MTENLRRENLFNSYKMKDDGYDVYAYVTGIENDMLQISIVTAEMQEYDQIYLVEKSNYLKDSPLLYKPYFCEFFCDTIGNEDKVLLWKKYIGSWVKANLKYSDASGSGDELSGKLLVATSPLKKIEVKILYIAELAKDEKEKIDIIYAFDRKMVLLENKESPSYGKVAEELNRCSIDDNHSVRIYNVGQGNCTYIRNRTYLEAKNRIAFDVGLAIFRISNTVKVDKRIRNIFENIKPRMVILSHWDNDHILGAYLMKPEHYGDMWLAPDYEERANNGVSLRRLAKYLYLNNKLYLVGRGFNGESVYDSPRNNFHLYKGKAKAGRCGKNNNHGLIIAVENKQGTVTIMPGDCEYSMWSDDIWKYLHCNHNLVVPHHCGAMPMQILEENSLNQSTAVISVGKNTYEHPNVEHKHNLQQLGYDVIETRNKKWIDIVPEGVKIEEDFRMGVV